MAYTPEQRKAYDKAYRAANKERRATNDKAYCATEHGTQRRAAAFKAWYGANRDRKAAALKAWKADNPEKVRACDAHRRALKSRACPPWADRKAIEAVYSGCPDDHHVDHIHPLKGRKWRGKWEPGDSLLWLLELPDDAEDISPRRREPVQAQPRTIAGIHGLVWPLAGQRPPRLTHHPSTRRKPRQ
jgi:hypothetical protein